MIESWIAWGMARWVKLAVSGGIIAVAVGSCMYRDHSLINEGKSRVIAESARKGRENNERSAKAREEARKPGSPDRLLCRDCE